MSPRENGKRPGPQARIKPGKRQPGLSPEAKKWKRQTMSKLAGAPVQVAWSRSEEFFYDTFQPAAVVKIVSGLDGANKLVLWD